MVKKTTDIYHDNIESETLENDDYRRVVYTVPGSMQLVYMSIAPNDEIPKEMHPHVSQFFRFESGVGEVVVEQSDGKTISYSVTDGSGVIIPHGVTHTVKNLSSISPLKLYSIYTPPNHPSDRLQPVRVPE